MLFLILARWTTRWTIWKISNTTAPARVGRACRMRSSPYPVFLKEIVRKHSPLSMTHTSVRHLIHFLLQSQKCNSEPFLYRWRLSNLVLKTTKNFVFEFYVKQNRVGGKLDLYGSSRFLRGTTSTKPHQLISSDHTRISCDHHHTPISCDHTQQNWPKMSTVAG